MQECVQNKHQSNGQSMTRAVLHSSSSAIVKAVSGGNGIQERFARYVDILRQCGKAKDLLHGKRVHSQLKKSGYDQDQLLGNHLVDMYGKCGTVEDACAAFERTQLRTVYSWNIMLAAYTQNGHLLEAKELFDKMPQRNVITYSYMITAYARKGSLEEAKCMFDEMPTGNVVAWTAMIQAYAHQGHLEDAKCLFDRMPERNVVSWTAMVAAFSQSGDLKGARCLFDGMPERDLVSWNSMVSAYAQKGHLEEASSLFEQMPDRNVVSWTTMVQGYAGNAQLGKSKSMFDTMHERTAVSWTTMILAYADNGHLAEAQVLFQKMPERDLVTCTVMVESYAHSGHLEEARIMFDNMPKRNVVTWIAMVVAYAENGHLQEARSTFDATPQMCVVSCTAMITGYAQHGYAEEARILFDKLLERDIVSWNAMIAAYAQNGQGRRALELFRLLDLEGLQPNKLTFVSILDACASLSVLAEGKLIHSDILDAELLNDVEVNTALLNLYSKCGTLEDAHNLFDKMGQRDAVAWAAMIAAYAQNGHASKALEISYTMILEGVQPLFVTFISILAACSHEGRLKDGLSWFVSISRDFDMVPVFEHFRCVVDLLGRAGYLEEAEELANNMPFKPDAATWRTLLGACRVHNDMERGKRAARHVLELDPEDGATYILLSNIYSAAKDAG